MLQDDAIIVTEVDAGYWFMKWVIDWNLQMPACNYVARINNEVFCLRRCLQFAKNTRKKISIRRGGRKHIFLLVLLEGSHSTSSITVP